MPSCYCTIPLVISILAPFSLVGGQSFSEEYSPSIYRVQSGSVVIRIIGIRLPNCAVLQPRRSQFESFSVQLKRQIIYVHTHTPFLHTYIHTHIHTYACVHALYYITLPTYLPTYTHTYIHTYSYIHTYTHTYIHTCIHNTH